jgi:hypothetical protein
MKERGGGMVGSGVVRFVSVRGRVLCMVGVFVLVGVLSPVASWASGPTGIFAIFDQCPRFTAGVDLCIDSQITGGEVTLNKLTVPITNPITFQGGIVFIEGSITNERFVGALDGETFGVVPQSIPGGLSSLIDCNEIKGRDFYARIQRKICKKMFENRRTPREAYETIELARPASEIGINTENDAAQTGTTLSLPVKIHLENPLLGKECYIGTSADPIVLEMTSGTTNPPPPNKPISGSLGTFNEEDEFLFIELKGHSLVNNTFSAPAATGCGGPFSSIIDNLIDTKIGLPSPSGYNTVIHVGTARNALPFVVIATE